jgi:hypothetical protein
MSYLIIIFVYVLIWYILSNDLLSTYFILIILKYYNLLQDKYYFVKCDFKWFGIKIINSDNF